MVRKRLIVLGILLISFLCISAVSATEDMASDIYSTDNNILDNANIDNTLNDNNEKLILENDNQMEVSNSNSLEANEEDELNLDINCANNQSTDEIFKKNSDSFTYLDGETEVDMGDFALLQNAIDNADENTTLYLQRNFTYTIGVDNITNGIKINKTLTIYGNGFTIDALGQSKIFDISAPNVILNNISFSGGVENKAVIELWRNAAGSKINNCNFTRNNLAGYCAIFVAVDNVEINNCSFIGNNATTIRQAVDKSGLIIFNCLFDNNTQAIHSISGKNLLISNCTFKNHSNSFTGSIYIQSDNVIIRNSSFMDNTAMYGAAISLIADNIIIENCNFTNNSAQLMGGAIRIVGDYLFIDGCDFTGNFAEEGSAIYYVGSVLNISNSTFLNNKANSTSIELIADFPELIIKFTTADSYINAINSVADLFMENVTYWNGEIVNTDDVSPIYRASPGQNITLEIYDDDGGLVRNVSLTTDQYGQIQYNVDDFADGHYVLYAYHYDDSYYTYIGGLIGTFDINRNSSSVSINIEDKEEFVHDSCNITFTVENRTEVRVVITNMDGSEVFINETVENDYFIVDLPIMDEYYNITVSNLETRDVLGSEDSKLFKIIKAASTIQIAPIPDIVYNNTVTVEFSGENLTTVNISVYDRDNNLVFSQNTTETAVVIPVLAAGSYNVQAINYGNENISQSNSSVSLNIVKAESSISLNPIEDMAYGSGVNVEFSGDNITIVNVSVYGRAGILVFSQNTTENSVVLPILAAGRYTVVATNYGNENISQSNSSTGLIINKDSVTLSLNNVTTSFLEPADFVIEVTDSLGRPVANARIIVRINSIEDKLTNDEGKVIISTEGLDVNNYTVFVIFPENQNYTSASDSASIVITSVDTFITITAVNTTYGENTVIDFTLKDAVGNNLNDTISVIFNEEIKIVEVIDGVGKLEINNTLNADTYLVVAKYYGSSIYNLSIASNTFKVDKLGTQILFENMDTIAVASVDGRVGDWFTWTLKDSNGKPMANTPMQIGFNGVVYDEKDGIVTDENGVAKLQINLGYKGDYTFAICYLGDENHNASFVVAKITVKVQTPTLTVPNKSYKVTAKTKALTATFKTVKGTAVANKKISFTVNGKTYSAKTNDKGVAIVNVTLTKKGSYTVTAKFAGDSTFAAVNKTAVLKLT